MSDDAPGYIVLDGISKPVILLHRVTTKTQTRGVVAVAMDGATAENVTAALVSALALWAVEKLGPLTPQTGSDLAIMLVQEIKRMIPTVRPPEAGPRRTN